MINKLQTLREARRKGESGFTIIEVLIVLAIAGLIMLIVFLAVPALQRNSRNTSRRSDASHLAGLINEYASNHAGSLPTAYGASGLDISQEKWAVMNTPSTFSATFPADASTLVVASGKKCDQSTNTLSAGGNRAFAVLFQVETSSGTENACING